MNRKLSSLEPLEASIAGLLCVGFVSLWLAHVLVLPPFEGFDETAHYSYVSLLADRHQIPDFRKTPLDAAVLLDNVPRRWAGRPPFDDNGGLTYPEFFSKTDRATAAKVLWSSPPENSSYAPGDGINWQGQHPPLFYAILAMPYRLTVNWPIGWQLLVLRLVSTGLAAGSLVFWFLLLPKIEASAGRRVLLGAAAAVVLLPSCSFDIARLGNDSLATLLLSAVVYFAFLGTQRGRLRDDVVLAVLCGLGLLTKAWFLPVTAGVVCFRIVSEYVDPPPKEHVSRVRVFLILIPFAMASAWFAMFYNRYGMLLGSEESWTLAHGPRLADTLSTWSLVLATLRSVAVFVATFLWSGTWSWVHRPYWQYVAMVPLLLLAARGLGGRLLSWRGLSDGEKRLNWLAAAVLIPVLAGFAAHIWLRVSHTGIGTGTGGYYLFFAWPVVGIAMSELWTARKSYIWLAVIAALLFEATGLWFTIQVYAGFIQKTGELPIGVGGIPISWAKVAELHNRLRLLAFPSLAAIAYAVSVGVRLCAFSRLIRHSAPGPDHQ